MLLALREFVYPHFDYVGDVHVDTDYLLKQDAQQPIESANIFYAKRKKPAVPTHNHPKPVFLEDVLDELKPPSHASPSWVLPLTVKFDKKYFRRVLLVFRHNLGLGTVFFFDPERDPALRNYVRHVLFATPTIKNYEFHTVIRRPVLSMPDLDWLPMFVMSALVLDRDRILSRFNAEVQDLKSDAAEMDRRLRSYITAFLQCYRTVMETGVQKTYNPTAHLPIENNIFFQVRIKHP